MKLGSLFVSFSLLLGFGAFWLPAPPWIMLWVGTSLMLVGLGYLGLGPGVFGKRSDGSVALWSTVLLLPYLLCIWTIWRFRRLVSATCPFQELIPGIIIGRRLFPWEYPAGVDSVLDLTCEFPEFREIRQGKDFFCFPILDGHAPKVTDLVGLTGRIEDVRGTLYIHCAEGYGRTAVVAAAILLAKGLAGDPHQAIRTVQQKRPGVTLSDGQRLAIAQLAQALKR